MENRITESVYWIGVHFPEPPPGFSVNAYLIKDRETTVIDTGMPASAPYILQNIKALTDPKEIRYIVLTHADLDHGGGLATLLAEAPQATVVTSEGEAGSLGAWGVQPQVKVVSDGDTLTIGKHRLNFLAVPFTCTPGSMAVFEESEGVLFSSDLFAAPGPSQWQVFADTDQTEMLKMMQKMKLGNTQHTRMALDKVKDLPVKIIAAGHGAMIRTNIGKYIDTLRAEVV